MRVPAVHLLSALAALLGLSASQTAVAGDSSATLERSVRGVVAEFRSGTPDVVVILCDQETGLPISASSRRRSFIDTPPSEESLKLLTATTDKRGEFVFDNLEPGEYRLIAQKWVGPFHDTMEMGRSVVQLFGTADHIRVPSPEAQKVALRPAGNGVLSLNEDLGNNDTFLAVSTEPPVGDAALGFAALGKRFLSAIVATNRMPAGRTTILGLPGKRAYVWMFAPDNSPGFALKECPVWPLPAAERIGFVAGWSDGRHDPPPRIAQVMEQLKQHGLHPREVLQRAGKRPPSRSDAQATLFPNLDEPITIAQDTTATLGEMMAAEAYTELLQNKAKRLPRK